MASGPITSWEIDGEQWKQCQTLFWGAPKSLQIVTAAMKLKDTYSLEGKLRVNVVQLQNRLDSISDSHNEHPLAKQRGDGPSARHTVKMMQSDS